MTYRNIDEAVAAYQLRGAMVLYGRKDQQEKLITLLKTALAERHERLYYIMGVGRRIFHKKEARYETVGVTTSVKTTMEPEEARKLARELIRKDSLKVRVSLYPDFP